MDVQQPSDSSDGLVTAPPEAHVRASGWWKAALVVASVILGVTALSALAAGAATGNPWPYQMSDTGSDGLVVTGARGSYSQAILVRDWAGQPVFGVGQAGGAAVYGDDFRLLPGTDIYHGQITLSVSPPNPAMCVRAGQLWIGGPTGSVWRCQAGAGGVLAWRPLI